MEKLSEPLTWDLEFCSALSIISLVITLNWNHLNLLLVVYFCSRHILLMNCKYVKLLQHYMLLRVNACGGQIRTLKCKCFSGAHAGRNDFQDSYASLKHGLNHFCSDSTSFPLGWTKCYLYVRLTVTYQTCKCKARSVTLERKNKLLVTSGIRTAAG